MCIPLTQELKLFLSNTRPHAEVHQLFSSDTLPRQHQQCVNSFIVAAGHLRCSVDPFRLYNTMMININEYLWCAGNIIQSLCKNSYCIYFLGPILAKASNERLVDYINSGFLCLLWLAKAIPLHQILNFSTKHAEINACFCLSGKTKKKNGNTHDYTKKVGIWYLDLWRRCFLFESIEAIADKRGGPGRTSDPPPPQA